MIIRFVHSAPTPHNNFLLDSLASRPDVELHRYYLFGPMAVPERPWRGMGAGEVQSKNIRTGISKYFDFELLRHALSDKRSVFFIIGWDFPILVFLLIILGARKQPVLIWDDGPSHASLNSIKKWWRPRQLVKRIVIGQINRSIGTYFYTGKIAKSGIASLGICKNKLLQMPFFVPLGFKDEGLRQRHGCFGGECLIIAGGRMTKDKAFDVLVEALSILPLGLSGKWKAVIVGAGPELLSIKKLIEMHGLSRNVDLVEWAEPETWSSYVSSGNVFVAPARFDHFPTTVIAAMQAGVAVIASNQVGSAVEFIETGISGTIVPAGDPSALASALALLISNPELRKRMAAAGQKTIQQWPVERGVDLIVSAATKALQECVE